MPSAYLLMAIWAFVIIIFGDHLDFPDWLTVVCGSSLYVMFALWPVYVLWVMLSKRLHWREKLLWLIFVTLGNMIGMAAFFIFMMRKYLGLEGRTGPRDEAALARFLTRHEIGREELMPDQLGVLRSHFRNGRQAKWGALAMLPMAALMVYMAIVIIPRSYYQFSSSFMPTHLVIVDRTNDTKEELEPDEETKKVYMQLMLTHGASAGVIGMCGLLFAMNAATLFFVGVGRQRLLVDFLKARKME